MTTSLDNPFKTVSPEDVAAAARNRDARRSAFDDADPYEVHVVDAQGIPYILDPLVDREEIVPLVETLAGKWNPGGGGKSGSGGTYRPSSTTTTTTVV